MFVFAGLVPHSPLLLPSIGKDNQQQLEKTINATKTFAENLFLAKPDTIIIISSHATKHEDAFSINMSDAYVTSFKDFGDMATSTIFSPDLNLIAQIRRAARNTDRSVTLNSSEMLDYGTGVPLELLTSDTFRPNIVPISLSGLSPKEHLDFGAMLKDVIHTSNKRIAVVASGDLSHCLTKDAPGGFHENAADFDNEVQRAITELSSSTLLSLDEELERNAKACVYQQLLILFGVIERKTLRPEILSYEYPFGVGYLVAQFHL